MTNGRIDDAEIDALLTGDQRLVDRYLVTGIRELTTSVSGLKEEVKAMREVCELRGGICPAMNPADPVTPAPPPAPETKTKTETETTFRTNLLWGASARVVNMGFAIVGAVSGSALTMLFSELVFHRP